jgi:hypothetical protein
MELGATQDATSCVTSQEILSILWNLGGGSLPHSQEVSTCLYPEPEQSSSSHPTPLIHDQSYYPPPTSWSS